VTSADAGNGPDKTSPNAVREISFQCKKGLIDMYSYSFKNNGHFDPTAVRIKVKTALQYSILSYTTQLFQFSFLFLI
jgi:hypothetical protein